MKLSFPKPRLPFGLKMPQWLDPYLVLSFALPFLIYMATLAPSVTFFDSGEFITAIAGLGSAHSPGYPLFLMYAKPFTLLPIGNIAFRVNMATAFSSSLACLGVYLLTVRLLRDNKLVDDERFSRFVISAAGLAAACSFAFTPRLWLQSNHDKPYPLLSFVVAVIVLLLLSWQEKYRKGEDCPAYIYASCFLAAMALGIHQTVVLMVPPWCLFILMTDWRLIKRIKEIVIAVLFALLGFAGQLYLPLRAAADPMQNWGDTKTVGNFLWHFLRRGYGDDPHVRDAYLLWSQLKAFSIPHEFTWLGVLLVLLALMYLLNRKKAFACMYVTAVFIFLLVIVGYFNTPFDMIFLTEEFFTPLYLLSAVMTGVGLYNLLLFAVRRTELPEKFSFKIYGVVLLLFFSLPLCLCAANYYENDQHDNYIAYDYAQNTLRTLPQDAVLFTWGDSGAFPLWYVQGVERMRQDVQIPHTPHLLFNWYLDTMPTLFKNSRLRDADVQSSDSELALGIAISEVIGRRPVYMDFSTRYSVNFSSYQTVQRGIIYRVRRSGSPSGFPDASVWENYSNRGVMNKISFLDIDTEKAIQIYAHGYLESGELLLSAGENEMGTEMLNRAMQVSPGIRKQVEQVYVRFGGRLDEKQD